MDGTTSVTPDDNQVVYRTTTGEDPKGGPSLTKEATELPPPTKAVRKTTTKKHAPRVAAPAEPLHTHFKWDEKHWAVAQAAVRPGERLVIISDTEARTVYTR
jgi:hypothetical protein